MTNTTILRAFKPEPPPDDFIQLLPGLYAAKVIKAEVAFDDRPGVTQSAELELDRSKGRYFVTALNIASAKGITTVDVRRWSLPQAIAHLARSSAVHRFTPHRVGFDELLATTDMDAVRELVAKEGPKGEALWWVVAIHTYMSLWMDSPTQRVGDLLGMSVRTVARWVARARAEGLIGG